MLFRSPKGGALTLNAISGIGMLAVGTLGFPYIGIMQADKENNAVVAAKVSKDVPGLVSGGKLTVLEDKSIYEILPYQAISKTKLDDLVKGLPEEKRKIVGDEIDKTRKLSKQGALANMAFFPAGMLLGYLILIVYFKAKGGYQQVHIGGGGH